MNEVLSSLGAAIETGTETVDDSMVSPVEAELPGILQDLSDHAPEEFREATLMAAMPMLGTLATGIRAKYRDGKLNSPSFIVDIEAPQATGKSFVDAALFARCAASSCCPQRFPSRHHRLSARRSSGNGARHQIRPLVC